MDTDMKDVVDPDVVKQEEFQLLETGLSLTNAHLDWLAHLINSVPQSPSDLVHFCTICGQYAMLQDDPMLHKHQDAQGPTHHLFPLVQVQHSYHGMMGGSNYYVSVQALNAMQLPIGDVVSHMLPHPPKHEENGVAQKVSCMYVRPQTSSPAKWQGTMLSGKCAFRECERVFSNKQTHLRQYGITPQFCSISCKLKTFLNLLYIHKREHKR